MNLNKNKCKLFFLVAPLEIYFPINWDQLTEIQFLMILSIPILILRKSSF